MRGLKPKVHNQKRSCAARAATLDELKQAELATWKRTEVYSFGADESFLLDRMNSRWREQYFQHMLSTDEYFSEADRASASR